MKSFRYMTRTSRQKIRYLENKKSFCGEIKSIFQHFKKAFSCQKLSQTWECACNTRASLRNISCVLLNLTRILLNLIHICNVQRPLLPVNVHLVNIHIFSLVHLLRLLLTLNFVPLPCLFDICLDTYIQLGRMYLQDVWGLHWPF